MARSLFEELRARQAAPTAPPKLTPNVYAKIARFAWRNAATIIAAWLALTLVCGFALWRNLTPPLTATLPLPIAEDGANATALGFGSLSNLQTITLTNARPDLLEDQRNDLVVTMRQRDDIYQTVFAPGSGDYYETNGLLYHPLDEVKGRVAYALSLRPLFNAISEAPSANSMATLVSEISAAIQQGRDPQGLDDLLSESAQSVQALMSGEDKPVDWSKLADLNNENTAPAVVVLAVPKPGQEGAARSLTLKLLSVIQNSSATNASLSQPGTPPPKRITATIDWIRAMAAAAIGTIFVALTLALALGRLRLILVAFVPPLIIAVPVALALVLEAGSDWLALWPLGLGIIWIATMLSIHAILSKVSFASGRKAREALVMLSEHQHGQEIAWLWLIYIVPFAGLIAISSGIALAALALGLALLSYGLVLTLPTALLRFAPEALQWRAGEWLVPAHRSLFETGQWQWLARTLGGIAVLGALAFLVLGPTPAEIRRADVPVSVVAANSDEAEFVIKRLKSFREAKSVRWLGMFMPQDAEAKLEAFHELKDQFPRITPVQSEPPDDLRDQLDTLQNSLKEIADTEQTQPHLRQAADEFRRSLALLAATSGDVQIRQLENRLFGGFNRLADRADVLSGLALPKLASLPGELQILFGSPAGPMRIEVTPEEGTSNTRLAEILEQADFKVLHPSVEQQQANRAVTAAVTKVFGFALLPGLVVLFFALRKQMTFFTALVLLTSALVVAAASGTYWQLEWNLTNLLQVVAVLSASLGLVWLVCTHKASTATSALELFLLPTLALALVLPFAALNIAPVVLATVPMGTAVFAAAVVVGLLRQHRAPQTRKF